MAFGDWVQGTSKDAGTTTSSTLVFGSNVTAGNTLIVSVRHGGSTDDTTVSDNLNGTWTKDKTLAVTSAGVDQVWRFSNTAAGACTVTVAFSASASMRWTQDEYTGNFAMDAASTIVQGNNTSPTASFTTSHTCCVYANATTGANVVNGTLTIAGGFTQREEIHNASGTLVTSADMAGAQAAGSFTATWAGMGTTDTWGVALIGYFDAGTAAAAGQGYFPDVWGRVDDVLPWDTRPYEVGTDFYWFDPGTPVSTADQSTTGYLNVDGNAYAIVTGDHTVVGYTAAGLVPMATVSHAANVTAILPAGVDLRATVSADLTIVGWLPAAVDLRATSSHDTSLAGYLPAGIVALNGAYSTGFPTIGYLPIGADLRATVTADRNVSAILPAGVVPMATVTHAANVVGILPAGIVAYSPVTADRTIVGLLVAGIDLRAVLSASNDVSVVGILFLGATPRAVVTADRTVSALLAAGVDLRATVSRTASVAGYLAAGATPSATVSTVVSIAGRLYVGVFPAAGLGLGLQLVGVSVGVVTSMTSSGAITSMTDTGGPTATTSSGGPSAATVDGDDGITSGTSDGSIE